MSEILLYHGSKEEVVYPEIRITRYTKDFSWGFYCTNNYQQAYRWADRRSADGIVNIYRYVENALLSEYPGAKQISEIHLTKLTNLLATASKGRYGKDKAIQIRDAARTSIGSVMPAKFLELKHTIKLIRELTSEIFLCQPIRQGIFIGGSL